MVTRAKTVIRTPGRLSGNMVPTEAQERMLELVKKQHPSAYFEPLSRDDIMNPDKGIRMNYDHDSNELCWSGRHHTACNFKTYYKGDDAYAACYNCKDHWHIGRMHDQFRCDGDVVVNLRYINRYHIPTKTGTLDGFVTKSSDNETKKSTVKIKRVKVTSHHTLPHRVPETNDKLDADVDTSQVIDVNKSSNDKVNNMIDKLVRSDIKVLGIQSPMGTGKTYMLKDIVAELNGLDNKRVCHARS
jgi:hypothetical protein